jgi:hypothetical protein
MQPQLPLDGSISAVLFSTGQIVSTPGALSLLEQFGVSPLSLISRHIRGDWGTLSNEDVTANNNAVSLGNRILSSYPLGDDRVWIITEWDRSATTLLLPDEY